MYCFVPSFEADKGTAFAYDYIPDFLFGFSFCAEIEKVTFELSCGNNTNLENLRNFDNSNKGQMNWEMNDGNKFNNGMMTDDIKTKNMEIDDGNKFNHGMMNGDIKTKNREMKDGNKLNNGMINEGKTES